MLLIWSLALTIDRGVIVGQPLRIRQDKHGPKGHPCSCDNAPCSGANETLQLRHSCIAAEQPLHRQTSCTCSQHHCQLPRKRSEFGRTSCRLLFTDHCSCGPSTCLEWSTIIEQSDCSPRGKYKSKLACSPCTCRGGNSSAREWAAGSSACTGGLFTSVVSCTRAGHYDGLQAEGASCCFQFIHV